MKRIILVLFMAAVLISAGCASSTENAQAAASSAAQSQTASSDAGTAQTSEQTGSGAENYTKYTDYTPTAAQVQDVVKGTDSSVLVAYFSRSGNTDVSGADAVSSASLTVNSDGTTSGNTQLMAEWIAEQTGGDLFLIQTEYTYPVDYDQAVDVGEGQDIDGYLPEIVSKISDVSGYRQIFLVYPVWHYTMSAPVRSFLSDYDFSGKTIFAYDVNAGSGFADTISVIEELQPGAAVVQGLAISQNNVEDSEQEVKQSASELLSEYAAQSSSSNGDESMNDNQTENAVKLSVNGTDFNVVLEDNDTAKEFAAMFADAPLTIEMTDYSGFEKVGSLGRELTANNVNMTTQPGDIVLYNGSNIVMFYGSNTWDYTKIGSVEDLTGWNDALGSGDVTAVFG